MALLSNRAWFGRMKSPGWAKAAVNRAQSKRFALTGVCHLRGASGLRVLEHRFEPPVTAGVCQKDDPV
jgi:hypothetical protein